MVSVISFDFNLISEHLYFPLLLVVQVPGSGSLTHNPELWFPPYGKRFSRTVKRKKLDGMLIGFTADGLRRYRVQLRLRPSFLCNRSSSVVRSTFRGTAADETFSVMVLAHGAACEQLWRGAPEAHQLQFAMLRVQQGKHFFLGRPREPPSVFFYFEG